MTRVRRNPLSDSLRRALDVVTSALSAHDVWVNEYQNPGGSRGVEYVSGFGREGVVVASWDGAEGDQTVRWTDRNVLTDTQAGLVSAHANLFRTLR